MKPSVRGRLLGWIGSGLIACVWLGIPSHQFFLGRTNLSDEFFLAHLGPARLLSVGEGYAAAHSGAVSDGQRVVIPFGVTFRQCCRQSIPVALENPDSSLLWQTPQTPSLGVAQT